MEEFLAIATSFPTSVYTVLVMVSLVYWMVGIAGLAGDHGDGDADLGDAGDADLGDADLGDADLGDADLGDADVGDVGDVGDSDLGEVAAHGAAHGHAHGSPGVEAHDGGVFEGVMGLLSFLHLRHAPLSITLTLLFLLAWVFTFLGTLHGLPLVGGLNWLTGSLVGVLALLPAIPITSLVTKPLAPLFKQHFAPGRRHFIGHVGVVRIGGGKTTSAQIRLKDPGTGERGLLLRVTSEEELQNGDEVLIIDYDEDRKAYISEPMEAVLPSKKSRD